MSQNTFIILDTETTGLMPLKGDAIIELAAFKICNKKIIDKFKTYVNPMIPITPGSSRIHGLDNAFIAKHGRRTNDVFPAFKTFCQNSTLVGHNINRFDLVFINKHLKELNLTPLDNPTIDTLVLARQKLTLPNYKLGTIADYFNISYEKAHQAMEDVKITTEVFLRLYY